MIEKIIETEGVKDSIVRELRGIGVCDVCVLRYLGVREPNVYRSQELADKILEATQKELVAEAPKNGDDNGEVASKLKKPNPCTVCLGLLQDCIKQQCLENIAEEIGKAGIQAMSYAPMLTLPISIQIRSRAVWFHLESLFPLVYKSLGFMKPEGIGMKSVWKWISTMELKRKVDSKAEWMTNGDLVINMFLQYKDDKTECQPLLTILRKENRRAELTRGNTEHKLESISKESFCESFPCPPSIPNDYLSFEKISCSHCAMFVAGRYCKFSRDVSQSPWLNPDGTRVRGEASVQELIVQHVKPIFNCDSVKFSSSGREDSDVRMLGKGRPFVLEVMNPKKTVHTQKKIQQLQDTINTSTQLISVRDMQIVQKHDLAKLRDAEETKNKFYVALCKTPGREVTQETLDVLNKTSMPLVLEQITPLRVLHRRSLIARKRSILEINAQPCKRAKDTFILSVKTEAGTYVKEFVHGDFGRTSPNVAELLGCPTDILSLDVTGVELDWPAELK